jgi:hypothetical protein
MAMPSRASQAVTARAMASSYSEFQIEVWFTPQ